MSMKFRGRERWWFAEPETADDDPVPMNGVQVEAVRELWGRVSKAEPDLLAVETPQQMAFVRSHVPKTRAQHDFVGMWWSKDSGESATVEEFEELSRKAFMGPVLLAVIAAGFAAGGTQVSGWLHWAAWIAAAAIGALALWSFGVSIVFRIVADALKRTGNQR
jgi:hypothetical protein